jgi:hypothetical protein
MARDLDHVHRTEWLRVAVGSAVSIGDGVGAVPL